MEVEAGVTRVNAMEEMDFELTGEISDIRKRRVKIKRFLDES